MKRTSLFFILLFVTTILQAADYIPKDYVWTTQSKNSSESMPCGGHDIGLNVWVENGDVLFYIQQSGWFDENNTLLKAGRWRLHFENHPFEGHDFQQRLCLDEGAIYIHGGEMNVRIWVDVFYPIVFVELDSKHAVPTTISYESWRYQDRPVTKAECQQCSYKWILPTDCTTYADSIEAENGQLLFSHKNRAQTVFDFTVSREHLNDIKTTLYNPIGGRDMNGKMTMPGFKYIGTNKGIYASTDYKSWNFFHHRMKKSTIQISLFTNDHQLNRSPYYVKQSKDRSNRWWHNYWQRSWIQTDGSDADLTRIVRNYELFRYILGCNAYGQWPTKFNGGLFSFDPVYVDSTATFTPDYRKWGGGTMTAQNQRLVYWPMLKSGDTDMMKAQFDTYLRLLPTAESWSRYHWNHEGACFTEQIENFGLPNPAEYGKHPDGSDYGVEHNAWLEYEWDTVLEFCQMILLTHRYTQQDIVKYEPLISSCLHFFDEHYQYLAKQRGAKALNADNKLIIYPGSGCETYKMAYNPSSTIAALRTVLAEYITYLNEKDSISQSSTYKEILDRIPEIPLTTTATGDTCIAPAVTWARIQNVETPQLYPVFPWRIYGIGKPNLHIAKNTYLKDSHAIEMRSSKGWKQDNIWAACLGLTKEATRLSIEKFADGPYRFPAFWEAGFDWAPDHNRGGSAMIGLEEMLLQEAPDGSPILFPAWPKKWNVSFRLHATNGRVIEASIVGGKVIKH
ncbi:MAG: hypothetical protein IKX24_13060 [Prevotella sp.]|nr:hypothetical protein [Prevotella sp.]